MKKIKVLTSVISLGTIATCVAPIATSCSVQNKTIPTSLLNIVGYTLKGFKADVDISGYDTLEIPSDVQYIDEGAFKNVFQIGNSGSSIQKIKFNNAIREIRKNAFEGCNSIKNIDVSSWDTETSYYLTIDSAFNNCSIIGNVKFGDGISKETKNKIQTLLIGGGIDSKWFAEERNDKVEADKAWLSQKASGGFADFLFNLNNELPSGAELYATVVKKNSTKGVDVDVHTFININKQVVTVPVKLVNCKEDNDFAEFDVIFVAEKVGNGPTTPLWKQTVSGFKLTNIKREEAYSEEIDLMQTINETTPLECSKELDAHEVRSRLFAEFEKNPHVFLEMFALHTQKTEDTSKWIPHKDEQKIIWKVAGENLVFNTKTQTVNGKLIITQKHGFDSEHDEYVNMVSTIEFENLPLIFAYMQEDDGYGLGFFFKLPEMEEENLPKDLKLKTSIKANNRRWDEEAGKFIFFKTSGVELIFDGNKWNTDSMTADELAEADACYKIFSEDTLTVYPKINFLSKIKHKQIIKSLNCEKTLVFDGENEKKINVEFADYVLTGTDQIEGDIICTQGGNRIRLASEVKFYKDQNQIGVIINDVLYSGTYTDCYFDFSIVHRLDTFGQTEVIHTQYSVFDGFTVKI